MRLAADRLSVQYRIGTPPVIVDLTHEFEPGALTIVSGPSGSGKSTLLYVLALMMRPSAGAVLMDGLPVSAQSDSSRARTRAATVGFVFQDAALDPARTVLDNVLEGALYAGRDRSDSVETARDLLDRFGVLDRAHHRPGQVSGGQAQRVALCRALVKRPPVVLADEPTGNLDQASAEVVWQALHEEAASGATVVVATHDSHRVSSATRALTL